MAITSFRVATCLIFLVCPSYAFVLMKNECSTYQLSKPRNSPHSIRTRLEAYVPDGLTAAEYAEIKQNEAKQISEMNYGAWGPRFRQSNVAPAGNWFNNAALWQVGAVLSPTTARPSVSLRGRLFRTLTKVTAAIVLAQLALVAAVRLTQPNVAILGTARLVLTGKFVVTSRVATVAVRLLVVPLLYQSLFWVYKAFHTLVVRSRAQ